ncbi:MAG: hypothetical protein AAF721_22780 [Myxococcota bacterium]
MGRFSYIAPLTLSLLCVCTRTEPYTCESDAECTLSGTPGVCTEEAHCAYPTADCPSGLRYPTGAPEGLAGTCASGTPPMSSSSGAAMDDGGESSGGQGSTSAATAGGSESAAVSTASSSGGDCVVGSEIVELIAVADTFALEGGNCSPVSCDEINFGTTANRQLSGSAGTRSVYLIRFDTSAELSALDEYASVQLVMAFDADNGGVVTVAALDPAYPWIEGLGDGEQAESGEATWRSYQHERGEWPARGGPPAAATVILGEANLAIGVETASIPLSAAEFRSFVEGGGNSLLVEHAQSGPIFAVAREGNTVPRLAVAGCQ